MILPAGEPKYVFVNRQAIEAARKLARPTAPLWAVVYRGKKHLARAFKATGEVETKNAWEDPRPSPGFGAKVWLVVHGELELSE